MRIVSWNMNKRKNGTWDFLINNINADIALLQETSKLAEGMDSKTILEVTVKRNLRNSIYSPHYQIQRIKLPKEISTDLICGRLMRDNAKDIFFVSIYGNLAFSPFFTVFAGQMALVMTFLRTNFDAGNILISGDFNADRRMDDNPTGSRFARKGERVTNLFFDSILNMGFKDCLREFYPDYVQTIRHNRTEYPWQIDHMFCTGELYERLTNIYVSNGSEVLPLSDHNPIIADFDI